VFYILSSIHDHSSMSDTCHLSITIFFCVCEGILLESQRNLLQKDHKWIKNHNYIIHSGFGGLEVACWPFVPKFGRKNPQHAFLRRGSKAVCPMSCFMACKRTHKCRGSRHFRQNSRLFLAHTSTFRCWVRLRRFRRWGSLVAKVGTL
jgi:hypothetical protein